ncbi:hypothetical protein, conserved [Eimeria maxima]|uniref:Uncharacterized protein n=1 Tax=Eimeria maxima TaxID=5804 RepID=U6MDM7_EIMMA|nr:hypothetical protein, conserved [Eimeria maxima]CDJ60534.1 hypothetical protein, conserved [Eimeria maxima]
MAVPENRNIKWTVENSDPSIRKKSAFFGGGDSAASSHVGAVPNGKLSRQPNAKPTRARNLVIIRAFGCMPNNGHNTCTSCNFESRTVVNLMHGLETTVEYLAKEIPHLKHGSSVKMKRIATSADGRLTATVLVEVRLAEPRELELGPLEVREWAEHFLKHTKDKQAKLLMGSWVIKIKYSERAVAQRVESCWSAAETWMFLSTDDGRESGPTHEP